jgi:hypothetical protein
MASSAARCNASAPGPSGGRFSAGLLLLLGILDASPRPFFAAQFR